MPNKRPAGGWNVRRITSHPGAVLREDFLKPMGVSVNRLSLDLRVPVSRINDIVHERRSVTADTALRFGLYFDTTAEFWINLQACLRSQQSQSQNLAHTQQEVRPRPPA